MISLFQNIVDAGESIQEKVFLLDVRTPEEFAEGSVDGAVNIPLNILLENLSLFDNQEHIIVFCRSGARSGSAKSILERYDYKHIINGGPWQNVQNILDELKTKTV